MGTKVGNFEYYFEWMESKVKVIRYVMMQKVNEVLGDSKTETFSGRVMSLFGMAKNHQQSVR